MDPPSITFRALRIEGWRQFDNIDLELHPRLTVLTGANGAGKSSLLRIFSRHFGFDRPFLATPELTNSGIYDYITGLFESLFAKRPEKKPRLSQIGFIEYSNSITGALEVPASGEIQYSVSITNQQPISGIHIDSHQAIPMYRAVANIPANVVSVSQAYQTYAGEVQSRYNDRNTGSSPIYRLKEALISMAMFGEGNSSAPGNPAVLKAYLGFIETLRTMLPESLGFLNLSVRTPEIVVVTKSGEFLLDASSGGVMTLIDLAWRLYMYSLDKSSFVVTIDEPENHLHPSMQRSLMRSLIATFPTAQFIIATHSPFMVSSIKDSDVYVLRYAQRDDQAAQDKPTLARRIVSERLDTINKAGSASEVLRDVLGVSTTIPEWVEESIIAIISRYRYESITSETLQRLRQELSSVGYSELYPDALARLTQS